MKTKTLIALIYIILLTLVVLSCLVFTTTCTPSYNIQFSNNSTLSFEKGKHIEIENIKEGDVLSYGYHYSFLFVKKDVLNQLNIQSFKQFISSNYSTTTIGVDSGMHSFWLKILEFYSLEGLSNWETFDFYPSYCLPINHDPFKKYDIMFTNNRVFFNAHFYDQGNYLHQFVPVKAFPYILSTQEQYPFLMKYKSSNDRQQDMMDFNVYMYFRYGNLSEEDISFIKFHASVENVRVDYYNFTSMIERASAFFHIDFFNINPIPSDYLANVRVVNELPSFFVSEDFWNIPTLVLVVLYFLFLFASRLFLKPVMKIRLFIPYFPILLLVQELDSSNYMFYYCHESISYLRVFLFCFVCVCYGFTVMRIYYLRNIYSLMYNNQSSSTTTTTTTIHSDENRIKKMKFFTTKKFALLIIPGLSFVLSILLTVQCIAILFEIGPSARYQITNISFPIYPIIGVLMGICAVLIDIKLNWKHIREKGLKRFLLFDDPFNVRLDLMLMSLFLILVLANVILISQRGAQHAMNALNWIIYFVFTLICGGSVIIKELIITIKKDRTPKSELEKLLENQSFRYLFKEYSTKEMSLENYLFYEKLRDLVHKYGMNGFISNDVLKELESQFFSQESPYELNIPSRTRKLFYALYEKQKDKPEEASAGSNIDLLESGNNDSCHSKVSDLYTIIYNDLLTNMSDTHSRFLETDEFKQWHSAFTIQRKQSIIITNV